MVNVNNTPAVCHSMRCDFTYTVPTSSVSSFTFDPSSLLLTVVGSDLPVTTPDVHSDVHSVKFAQSDCTIDNSTVTATGF